MNNQPIEAHYNINTSSNRINSNFSPIQSTSFQSQPQPQSNPTIPQDLLSQSFEQLKMDPPAFLPNTGGPQRTNRSGSLYGQGVNPTLLNLEEQNDALYPQEVSFNDHYDAGQEGEAELYVPGLTSPNLFVLLPMNDSLTPLLERYINGSVSTPSRRDMTGEWRGHSLDDLILGRKWRSVAKYCQDKILECDPGRTTYLLAVGLSIFESLLQYTDILTS